ARVCRDMVDAALAVRTRPRDASARVAALDTLLLRERVPPHVVLEAATLASSALHESLGETRPALLAARRREHLTGPPLLLAAQLRAEARLAAAMGDGADAERARRHLAALRATR